MLDNRLVGEYSFYYQGVIFFKPYADAFLLHTLVSSMKFRYS